jgi:hypothetical protein
MPGSPGISSFPAKVVEGCRGGLPSANHPPSPGTIDPNHLEVNVSMDKPPRKSKRRQPGVVLTSWAVGHIKEPRLIALRLNGQMPFLLSAEEARRIAAALQGESDTVEQLKADADK